MKLFTLTDWKSTVALRAIQETGPYPYERCGGCGKILNTMYRRKFCGNRCWARKRRLTIQTTVANLTNTQEQP